MILLWGVAEDGPMRRIRDTLERQGAAHFFLDQDAVLETAIDLEVGRVARGELRVGSHRIDLERVRAAYVRPYDVGRLPSVSSEGPDSPARRHAAAVEDAVACWLEVAPARVVNRLSAMGANGSKPYQCEIVRRLGFRVPATLVTTDAEAALTFWRTHGEVIYKSTSSVRSIVSRLGADRISRLKSVANCPTQFQEYVDGRDHRVHVVGEEVFACEIASGADDYRYAARQGSEVELQPAVLPPDVADRCRTVAAHMRLPVAGIDLRRTPSGEWVCFEVNPSPAFTYYEDATGQPIAEAIARLLLAPSDAHW